MARGLRKKAQEPPPSNEENTRYLAERHAQKFYKIGNDVQTSLRLPSAMYEALAAAAEEHGRRIGEEIRRRLESTFALGLGEPETSEFASVIMQAAHQIDRAYGSWRTDPFAFAVFNVAISTLLAYYRPKGEAVRPPSEPGSLADTFFGPSASPESAGRAVAMAALSALGR